MRNIKNIVVHCSAGFSDAESIQAYFLRPVKDGGRGWKTGGYHRIVERDGTVKKMYGFETITNGVAGYNSSTIHVCYVGGVRNVGTKEKPIWIAEDTRTDAQIYRISECIIEAIYWLRDNGKDITHDLGVVGHRDFSPDNNGNGQIESWERIKECPSFDVIPEYGWLGSKDRYGKIPTL